MAEKQWDSSELGCEAGFVCGRCGWDHPTATLCADLTVAEPKVAQGGGICMYDADIRCPDRYSSCDCCTVAMSCPGLKPYWLRAN